MKTLISVLYILLFSASAYAQTTNRLAPPPLGRAKNLSLPAIHRFKLSNGLDVLLMEKHAVPLVQIKLLVQTGRFDDPKDKSGLNSFTLDVMDEGTDSLDALQLSDEIEFLGANISTYSSNFFCSIDCSTPTSKLDASLKLMSNIALKPRMAEVDIERILKLHLNGLLHKYVDPQEIATIATNKFLYDESTPYGKFPTEQSIRSFTKNDLVSLHRNNFVTGNSTLIVVGDITQAAITPILEKRFASFPVGRVDKLPKPEPVQIKNRLIYFIDKPGAAQSVIRISRIGTSRSSSDYNDLVVMNTILGGSFTSRLNTNLREAHGYSYGASSRFSFWPISGPFTASSSVHTDVTALALNEFFYEFKTLLTTTMPDDDLKRGKNYEALSYAGEFETNDDLANALADMVMYQLPDNYFNTYVSKILAVNKQSVELVAKKYIVPEDMLVVIVGDRKLVEEGLAKLFPEKATFLTIEDVLGKRPEF